MWLTGSIVLHAVGLLVIWLTPVHDMIFEQPDPTEFEVTARAGTTPSSDPATSWIGSSSFARSSPTGRSRTSRTIRAKGCM